jgi:hypothetical protein
MLMYDAWYSGLSLIATSADRACSNLSSGKKHTPFLKAWGLGVDEAISLFR